MKVRSIEKIAVSTIICDNKQTTETFYSTPRQRLHLLNSLLLRPTVEIFLPGVIFTLSPESGEPPTLGAVSILAESLTAFLSFLLIGLTSNNPIELFLFFAFPASGVAVCLESAAAGVLGCAPFSGVKSNVTLFRFSLPGVSRGVFKIGLGVSMILTLPCLSPVEWERSSVEYPFQSRHSFKDS